MLARSHSPKNEAQLRVTRLTLAWCISLVIRRIWPKAEAHCTPDVCETFEARGQLADPIFRVHRCLFVVSLIFRATSLLLLEDCLLSAMLSAVASSKMGKSAEVAIAHHVKNVCG